MTAITKRTLMRVLIASASVPAIMSAGCQTTADRERVVHRMDNLQKTVTIIEQQEAERPTKLGKLLTVLANRHERDMANAGQLPAEFERFLRQEICRWEQHLPIHERRIREQMQGNVENIERTLPAMLY